MVLQTTNNNTNSKINPKDISAPISAKHGNVPAGAGANEAQFVDTTHPTAKHHHIYQTPGAQSYDYPDSGSSPDSQPGDVAPSYGTNTYGSQAGVQQQHTTTGYSSGPTSHSTSVDGGHHSSNVAAGSAAPGAAGAATQGSYAQHTQSSAGAHDNAAGGSKFGGNDHDKLAGQVKQGGTVAQEQIGKTGANVGGIDSKTMGAGAAGAGALGAAGISHYNNKSSKTSSADPSYGSSSTGQHASAAPAHGPYEQSTAAPQAAHVQSTSAYPAGNSGSTAFGHSSTPSSGPTAENDKLAGQVKQGGTVAQEQIGKTGANVGGIDSKTMGAGAAGAGALGAAGISHHNQQHSTKSSSSAEPSYGSSSASGPSTAGHSETYGTSTRDAATTQTPGTASQSTHATSKPSSTSAGASSEDEPKGPISAAAAAIGGMFGAGKKSSDASTGTGPTSKEPVDERPGSFPSGANTSGRGQTSTAATGGATHTSAPANANSQTGTGNEQLAGNIKQGGNTAQKEIANTDTNVGDVDSKTMGAGAAGAGAAGATGVNEYDKHSTGNNAKHDEIKDSKHSKDAKDSKHSKDAKHSSDGKDSAENTPRKSEKEILQEKYKDANTIEEIQGMPGVPHKSKLVDLGDAKQGPVLAGAPDYDCTPRGNAEGPGKESSTKAATLGTYAGVSSEEAASQSTSSDSSKRDASGHHPPVENRHISTGQPKPTEKDHPPLPIHDEKASARPTDKSQRTAAAPAAASSESSRSKPVTQEPAFTPTAVSGASNYEGVGTPSATAKGSTGTAAGAGVGAAGAGASHHSQKPSSNYEPTSAQEYSRGPSSAIHGNQKTAARGGLEGPWDTKGHNASEALESSPKHSSGTPAYAGGAAAGTGAHYHSQQAHTRSTDPAVTSTGVGAGGAGAGGDVKSSSAGNDKLAGQVKQGGTVAQEQIGKTGANVGGIDSKTMGAGAAGAGALGAAGISHHNQQHSAKSSSADPSYGSSSKTSDPSYGSSTRDASYGSSSATSPSYGHSAHSSQAAEPSHGSSAPRAQTQASAPHGSKTNSSYAGNDKLAGQVKQGGTVAQEQIGKTGANVGGIDSKTMGAGAAGAGALGAAGISHYNQQQSSKSSSAAEPSYGSSSAAGTGANTSQYSTSSAPTTQSQHASTGRSTAGGSQEPAFAPTAQTGASNYEHSGNGQSSTYGSAAPNHEQVQHARSSSQSDGSHKGPLAAAAAAIGGALGLGGANTSDKDHEQPGRAATGQTRESYPAAAGSSTAEEFRSGRPNETYPAGTPTGVYGQSTTSAGHTQTQPSTNSAGHSSKHQTSGPAEGVSTHTTAEGIPLGYAGTPKGLSQHSGETHGKSHTSQKPTNLNAEQLQRLPEEPVNGKPGKQPVELRTPGNGPIKYQ